MKFLKRMFASKEVKAILGVLDEADQRFDCRAFEMVKNQIEQAVLSLPDGFAQKIRNGISPRQCVYSMIANIAGELLASGKFHLFPGTLNPLPFSGGLDLLRIFDAAVDEMVQIGAVDKDNAVAHKARMRDTIKTEG